LMNESMPLPDGVRELPAFGRLRSLARRRVRPDRLPLVQSPLQESNG
jgi:hypothetical protein